MQLAPFSDKNSGNMDDKAVRHKQAVPASSASPAPRELFPFVLGSEREVYQIFKEITNINHQKVVHYIQIKMKKIA